jgi:hypothetical protein
MKARIFITTICLTIVSFGIQAKVKDAKAITGASLSEFGNYSIEKTDAPMLVKGQKIKTYELVYENANRSVQIGVLPEKRCTNFILKTDMFEVEYVCNKNVFGVKKINTEYANISKDVNEAVLDKVGYFSQKVICQNPKTEEELLGLIACYFPSLIKEKYQEKF